MTTPINAHATEAQRLLDATAHALRPTAPSPDCAILAAQVHATLALEAQTARLADEQRTANLIALFDMGGPDHGVAGLDYCALTEQIAARLDLTQDVTP